MTDIKTHHYYLSKKLRKGRGRILMMLLVFCCQIAVVASIAFGQETETPVTKKEQSESMGLLPDQPVMISQLYESGLRNLRNDDPQEAAADLENVLRLDPTHIPAMINLARAYIDLEQYPKAGRMIEGAIVLDWANAEAHFVKGRLRHSAGNDKEAVVLYQRSIELESINPYAYNNLALIYIQDGRFDEAVPLLEKAISQKEDVVFFYNNLGIAYEGIENLQKAEKAFQQALRTDPSYDKALGNLDRVHRKLTERSITSGIMEGELDPMP